jgi:CubicO group peptidase (beta-lactamase class C family)
MKLRALLSLIVVTSFAISSPAQRTIPKSGRAVPGFEEFENKVVRRIIKDNIPGVAIAFVKDGRLVYARGFGWADEKAQKQIQPNSVFRLASISKSLTAIGILKLVQDRKLCMNQVVFATTGPRRYLPCVGPVLGPIQPIPGPGYSIDPRVYDITVQDLMQMSGGWITKDSGDWGFQIQQAATALGIKGLPNRGEVIRYGINHPLDYTPGTTFSYANFNFMILGQIIERVTGQPYEKWMKANVLEPMAARHANVGLMGKRLPNEVHYYKVEPHQKNAVCCMALPMPIIDSFGGWTASIIDLAHVQATLRNGLPRPNVIDQPTMELMVSRPGNPHFAGKFKYFTDGWDTVECPDGSGGEHGCRVKNASWEKGGDFGLGTITGYGSFPDGLGFVVLFNAHSKTNMPDINKDLIQPLLRNKPHWPTWDLFKYYRK